MKNNYRTKNFLLIAVSFLLLVTASCKKDNKSGMMPVSGTVTTQATPTTLGLYEADSSVDKLLFTVISKIGNNTVDYGLIFDTGSGGMVIDANGILPASMIGKSGFNFTTDSTVIDGITITSQKSIIEYGDDAATTDKVYGNLAYAPVTIGDQNGNIVIKRLPFFIYYKAVNANGKSYDPHEFDTFGVSPEYDLSFSNNATIMSPFSYFDPGAGLTRGFKMAALDTTNFSYNGTYVPVLTLGLTAADLSSSSGFTMTQLYFEQGDGYSPVIPATISYNNKTISANVVFDTGTEPYSYIEDTSAPGDTATLLPQKTAISVVTSSGFNYNYTITPTNNLTYIENPNTTGGQVTIISLEFFLTNEYMLDYTDHKLGLKNN
jgi:hypothetical protein